jgi:hypothetical protein
MEHLQNDGLRQEDMEDLKIELMEEYMCLGMRQHKSNQEVMEDYEFLSEGQSESKRESLKELMFPCAGQEIKATQARNRIKATQARNRIKATQAWDGSYMSFAIVCGFVPGVLVTVTTGNPDAGFIAAIISAIIVPIALIVVLG